MNKQEWKSEYRVWRSVLSSIRREHLKSLTKEEDDKVWQAFWDGCYMKMPEAIYKARCGDGIAWHSTHWGIRSKSAIQCNIYYLPNSYPHKCRNTGVHP